MLVQRLADYRHAGTRTETGTNVKGTTRMPADQIHPEGTSLSTRKADCGRSHGYP
jgi:hypothetical protein